MPRLTQLSPSYRKHRASGQAVVTLNGQDFYLGTHGTKASRNEYDRVIGEWLANGRRSLVGETDLYVAEVCAAFRSHALTYYRKPDGTLTKEPGNFDDAMRPLIRLYGHVRVSEFGPLAFKA